MLVAFGFVARGVVVADRGVFTLVDRGFEGGALGGLLLALAAAFVPGVEQLLQPRQNLLDGWQLSGRTGLAARALRTGGALRSGGSARTGVAWLARQTGLALWTGLSDWSRLALRAGLAACAVRATLAWMTLRSPAVPARPAARADPEVPAVPDRLPRRRSFCARKLLSGV
ncbi:hypothetical protein ACVIIW_000289 [Bradyrhizobium sp. USDA 4449]